MSRLVVVSNRVGDLRNPTLAGGLAVAVTEAITKRGGIWYGWDGVVEPGERDESQDRVGNVEVILRPMAEEDYEAFYLGFSNGVLWPAFHYRNDLIRYEPRFFEGYMRVNEDFAGGLLPRLKDDDLVWVHDYHFISFGRVLRQRGYGGRVGFFLHIPFPPPDILAALPNYAQLVEDLLHYDVVGFQTTSDLVNFQRCVEEFTTGRLGENNTIAFEGRSCFADRFPIGIDVDAFQKMAQNAPDEIQLGHMRREILGVQQIIGVDRLDYSKGIPDRFRAYSRMLSRYPEMSKRVSFLQIAPPTRQEIVAYADIREELERLSGTINGTFADVDWTPIRYIHRSIKRDKLAGQLRGSQVALVTPLRDGMNLVAKEYVAAQDPENPGVLVLSKFAGAAEEMSEALMVNPLDLDEAADAIYQALVMPLEERRERHAALLNTIRRFDVSAWQESFLQRLAPATPGKDAPAAGASSDLPSGPRPWSASASGVAVI